MKNSSSQYSSNFNILATLNLYVILTFTDILLEWNGVQSRIIQSNILANNGIIHIIDRILFKVEEETTTSSDSMNTRGVNTASKQFSAVVSYLLMLWTFCIVYLVKRWYDVSALFWDFPSEINIAILCTCSIKSGCMNARINTFVFRRNISGKRVMVMLLIVIIQSRLQLVIFVMVKWTPMTKTKIHVQFIDIPNAIDSRIRSCGWRVQYEVSIFSRIFFNITLYYKNSLWGVVKGRDFPLKGNERKIHWTYVSNHTM